MKPHFSGTFFLTGVGQSVQTLEELKIPLAGTVKVAGISRQVVMAVHVPTCLIDVLRKALDHPVEQVPLYRPELLRLNIEKG